jgi:RNA polymerase sigma factor (sigma-70 family)
VIGPHGSPEFPQTHWSVVLAAGNGTADLSHAALESLCRAYWTPLYSYVRREGNAPEVAQDLVQGFLARLLEREDLRRVAPDQGRFRSYLLAGLRHHLVTELRREQAQKRGGGAPLVSLDTDEAEHLIHTDLAEPLTPETVFDRRWAQTILGRALDRLQAEHVARGKGVFYETLRPTLTGDDEADYAALGARLDLTPGAIAVAIHRMRHRMRELVRLEVSQTVGSAADLEEEMRHLLTVWST